MPQFLVRMNCEFSIQVEAKDQSEAEIQANKTEIMAWDKAWSEVEVEDVE